MLRTSGQDGGVGRHTVPPRTTKRRTATNLSAKSNQNCQRIELYGSLITKQLKKKHSSRLVGGVVTGSRGGEDAQQGDTRLGEAAAGQLDSPIFACR